ncbi:MAG: undecaprenyl-diphosphate phosphatase [Candidatus Izemoplasmatales bacterium]|nr:undecaprenyl-diphosphate phosphatase [Candidatus Izemoplasmatales bacterium]
MDLIEVLKYIFLGIIQGLTEVLPVSSSGHVALSQALLNIENDEGILFLVLVNFGSMIAIMIYFRKMLLRLIQSSILVMFRRNREPSRMDDFHYVIKIGVATIPFALLGLFVNRFVNQFYTAHLLFVVAFGLLVTSTFLFAVRFAPEQHVRQKLRFSDAIVIGLIQPLAMIPGLSRSGITTSTGLLKKVSMETALTFSMMLYIPLSLGVFVYYLGPWLINPASVDIGFDPTNWCGYIYYFVSFVASFFATLISLKYIFKYFRQGKLTVFAIYTLILGLIALGSAIVNG